MCSKAGNNMKHSASAPTSPVSSCASGHILLVSMQKLRNPAFQRFGADLLKTLMITSVVKQARKFYQLGSDVPINCGCVRAESVFILPLPTVTLKPMCETGEDDIKQPATPYVSSDHASQPTSVIKVAASAACEARQQASRKHSLSPLRKHRGPKVSCVVPVVSASTPQPTHSSPSSPTSSPADRSHHNAQDDRCDDSKDSHYALRPEHQRTSATNLSHPVHSPGEQQPQTHGHAHHQLSSHRFQVIVAPVGRYFQFNHHQSSDDTPPVKKRRLAFLPHEPNAICITASVC